MNGVSTFIKNWGNKGIDLFKKKFRPNLVNLDVDWANTKWSGLAGPLTGIIGGGVGDFIGMNDKQDSLSSSINSYGQDAFDNITDNSSLIMAGTMPNMSAITDKDIRDKTWGEDIGSAVTNGIGAGFSTGNWLLGAGVAAFDLGKSLVERVQAGSLADTLEEQRRNKERGLGRQLYTAALGVDERNDFNRLMSYYDFPYDYAFGGLLHSHGGDYNGGLTYIDEGGRHEENPYEGVPSGFDEEGNPNLVEEGEVIWNNEYVFSDRLKVPEELAKKYKLGGKKDYTFAEAIEKVTKENRISPTDAITIATTKEIVNEFMRAQEALREQEQIAAREELEAAQAQDFLTQLEAAQSGGYPMGAPVNMGQASMGMPNEAPVTEGEMMPPGYAFGGNKFVGGGWKDYVTEDKDESGTTIYTTSDGMVFYSEAGAKKYIELNKNNLITRLADFEASPTSARVVANRQEQNLPAGIIPVYSKGRNGQRGPVHHYETSDGLNMGLNLDKAIKHQNELNESNAPAQEVTASVTQEPVAPTLSNLVGSSTIPATTVIATQTRSTAQPAVQQVVQSQPTVQQAQPEVTVNSKGQEEEILPDGVKVVYSKGRNGNRGPVHHYETSDGLNMGTDKKKAIDYQTRLNQNHEKRSPYRFSIEGFESPTLAHFSEYDTPWDVRMDGLHYKLTTPNSTTLSTPLTEGFYRDKMPFVDDSAYYSYNPGSSYAPSKSASLSSTGTGSTTGTTGTTGSTGTISTAKKSTVTGSTGTNSSSTGRMTTPSGNTINYRRDINGKEWEAAEPYQNFLSYMRGKGADDKEVKEWMEYIQNAIKESGSKYKLKDFDDWSRLAEDGKVGPVHQATLKAAEYFAKRRGLTAVDPTGKLNPTIGEALGVKPETTRGIPENSTSQSSTSISTATSPAEPQFNYRDTYLRYAPAIGSSMAALYGMLNRPDYSNADRVIDAAYRMGTPVNIPVETIGDYRRRNPYDERYLVNMANQNRLAAARGIANTAGGNRAMDLLGNMSLAHNNQQELGEIMRQAYLANRQDDAQVAEFNRGTNVYNMNALNQRNLSQAQLNSHRQQASLSGLAQGYGMRQAIKDNWDASTMQSLNSTLASLGAIGKENEEYNMLMSMAEEGYFDHAYMDNGRIRFVPKITSAKGGKLNRKKRRF